jgi:lipoic acid synthetase
MTIPKPSWLKVQLPHGREWRHVEEVLASKNLHTVCDEARCPNKGECWGAGTATFMIMGDTCTRGCRFCAVKTARQGQPLDPSEPLHLAEAVKALGLKYAVITSVDRDDLPDRGAAHFASCIRAIHEMSPGTLVEVLIPDYVGTELSTVLDAKPDVLAHNVETVRRLQPVRDPRASFDKSLQTLREAYAAGIPTKSSLLLGLGETENEVLDALRELRSAGVSIVVMGQYLRPTPHEIPVAEYINPGRFAEYAEKARALGFASVISAPFARTSYHAHEAWGAVDKQVQETGSSPQRGHEVEPEGKAQSARRLDTMKLEVVGKPAGCKLLRMTLEAEAPLSPASRVQRISIRGDFFAVPEEAFDEVEHELEGTVLAELGARFDALVLEKGIQCAGIGGAGLAELVVNLLAQNQLAQKEQHHGT